MGTLWQQKNYLTQLPFIVASNIYEYDIKKANINVLFAIGAIDRQYYQKLNGMPRMDRQIEIGWLIRTNPELSDKLSNGIMHFRQLFFEANSIDDIDVLSIKNDAIFIINKIPTTTAFNNVEFVLKNIYSSYMHLSRNIEIYFKSDMITNQFIFDVKGINDNLLKLHEDYMCSWIAQIMYYIELGQLTDALDQIKIFYTDYINRRLPIGYYRSFDSISSYNINTDIGNYTFNNISSQSDARQYVDISTNLKIIQQIYGYVTNLYFSRNKLQ